ncbi:MAG: hypothetical protein OEV92_00760 [Nitrospinota bacterium]|nr:hypothetical protein [Nitrospinota bacterium]
MTNMENRNEGENRPQSAPLSIWLRIFIVINIILLAGGAAWWAQDFVTQSAAQSKIDAMEDARNMAQLINANPAPRQTAEPFQGPVTYVLDASARDKWVHFSFARMAAATSEKISSGSDDWDILFRRAKILTNGGATGKNGKAEVAVLLGAKFEEMKAPPSEGYYKDLATDNIQENVNPALEKWYDYDFLTHKLRAKNALYVMKTARGEFVKFQLLNYYCGGVSGCYTIKYEFMGNESSGEQ